MANELNWSSTESRREREAAKQALNECKQCRGSEPAFATSAQLSRNEDVFQEGMSKRFYAACAAMQGILANQNLSQNLTKGITNTKDANAAIINHAYALADELLKQENE